MILPDVNLLIYAYDTAEPRHQAARRWWEEALSGDESAGLAWVTLLAFVRLTTSRAVFEEPLPVDEAAGVSYVIWRAAAPADVTGFATQAEALDAVRTAVDAHGPSSIEDRVLERVPARGDWRTVAEGRQLIERAMAPPALAAPAAAMPRRKRTAA